MVEFDPLNKYLDFSDADDAFADICSHEISHGCFHFLWLLWFGFLLILLLLDPELDNWVLSTVLSIDRDQVLQHFVEIEFAPSSLDHGYL